MQIKTINTISCCNNYFSKSTLHPLACLIDLSDIKYCDLLQLDFYSVWLKECTNCLGFGRKEYDFFEGTLSFLSPNQPINLKLWHGSEEVKSYLLCFHPSLIKHTPFEEHFSNYTFFHYRQNEALHISAREKKIIENCMNGISEELEWGIDEYSKTLLAGKIELLLNYCMRFYKRQFITRHEINKSILEKTNQLLENYFLTNKVINKGLPTIEYFSRMLGLSPAYFEDLLKHETGKNANEFILFKRIEFVCKELQRTEKTPADIAKEQGFPSVQYFCKLFKRVTGYSPNEYRALEIQ